VDAKQNEDMKTGQDRTGHDRTGQEKKGERKGEERGEGWVGIT
jgi:hypothetical protein